MAEGVVGAGVGDGPAGVPGVGEGPGDVAGSTGPADAGAGEATDPDPIATSDGVGLGPRRMSDGRPPAEKAAAPTTTMSATIPSTDVKRRSMGSRHGVPLSIPGQAEGAASHRQTPWVPA